MLVSSRQPQRDQRMETQWIEVRCRGCGRLLHRIEEHALRPGKHIEIKCARCKAVNEFVGSD